MKRARYSFISSGLYPAFEITRSVWLFWSKLLNLTSIFHDRNTSFEVGTMIFYNINPNWWGSKKAQKAKFYSDNDAQLIPYPGPLYIIKYIQVLASHLSSLATGLQHTSHKIHCCWRIFYLCVQIHSSIVMINDDPKIRTLITFPCSKIACSAVKSRTACVVSLCRASTL